jgi:hypothetical protein
MMLRSMGDSHVAALAAGWQNLAAHPVKADLDLSIGCLGSGVYLPTPFFTLGEDEICWTCEDYAKGFLDISGRETLTHEPGIFYGMCLGLHTGEIARVPSWREFCPWRISAPTLVPVSDGIVREAAKEYSRYVIAFYDAMLQLKIPFFVIQAPPFRKGHFCITLEGTRPDVAIEIDRLYRETISGELTSRGIVNVPPPRITMDDQAFLLPEYEVGGDDPHHANVDYGKLMIMQVLEAAAALVGAPAFLEGACPITSNR